MENDLFECVGTSKNDSSAARYVVGVYNKQLDTVVFHESPLVQLETHVKRFKGIQDQELIGVKNIEARNLLGQTFGTRKKRMAIKAVQENKIEIDSVEHIASAIQDNIQRNIASIPTRDEMKERAQSDKPIPPYNSGATHPDQVYNIYDIAPQEELALLPYKDLISLKYKEDLKAWLAPIQ